MDGAVFDDGCDNDFMDLGDVIIENDKDGNKNGKHVPKQSIDVSFIKAEPKDDEPVMK